MIVIQLLHTALSCIICTL